MSSIKLETSRKKIRIKPVFKTFASKQSGYLNQKTLGVIEEKIERTQTSKSHKYLENDTDPLLNLPNNPPSKFIKNFTKMNFINLFLKKLKFVSGKYGPLGVKQLKIINDVSTGEIYVSRKEEKCNIDTQNIFVKLIVNS